jgi:hypothetical protein
MSARMALMVSMLEFTPSLDCGFFVLNQTEG